MIISPIIFLLKLILNENWEQRLVTCNLGCQWSVQTVKCLLLNIKDTVNVYFLSTIATQVGYLSFILTQAGKSVQLHLLEKAIN